MSGEAPLRADPAPRPAASQEQGRLRLLVIGEQRFATHVLPHAGSVVVGSDARCEVRIDDPSIAPRHLRLSLAPLAVEELGSAAGTRLREAPLAPGEKVSLQPGDLVHAGSVILTVERRASPLRRILAHDYFEVRLEEECHRAERSQSPFAVLHVRCAEGVDPAAIEEVLAMSVRLVDIVAQDGPSVYELLLTDTPADNAEVVVSRLRARLLEKGAQPRVGIACWPRDGRSSEELTARATGAAHLPVSGASVAGVDSAPDGAMQDLHRMLERVAPTDISVLIYGETGVGKERFAEAVHQLSQRRDKPFVALNCAALTETLLESELFGHEKGAFTGASSVKLGLLESASGGTVFLDEAGELPMSIQVKLLRVLEERKVRRVGGLKAAPIDVRFVAATNRDLEAEIALGAFRQDLFFRLSGFQFVIPPLRERVGEIEALTAAFISDACRRFGKPLEPRVEPEVLSLFFTYAWPGNIRELRNVVDRAVLLCGDGPISLAHLPAGKMSTHFAARSALQKQRLALPAASVRAPLFTPPHGTLAATPPEGSPPVEAPQRPLSAQLRSLAPPELREQLEAWERQRIVDALAACAGNQTEAARVLGVSRRTLVKRLGEYSIPRPRKR